MCASQCVDMNPIMIVAVDLWRCGASAVVLMPYYSLVSCLKQQALAQSFKLGCSTCVHRPRPRRHSIRAGKYGKGTPALT